MDGVEDWSGEAVTTGWTVVVTVELTAPGREDVSILIYSLEFDVLTANPRT